MGTCAGIGSFAKMLVKPRVGGVPATFDGSSEAYSFLYETMSTERNWTGGRAITGTRSRYSNRTAPQPYTPRGMIGLQPGPTDFDKWLPRILGANESSDIFALAEDLPVFDMLIHKDNDIWRYDSCRVASARLSGRAGPTEDEGEIINLAMMIVAEDETDGQSWPVSAPALSGGAGIVPYSMNQGSLVLDSVSVSFDEFQLLVDNMLMIKHRNSLTPTCVTPTGRVVRLETENPFITGSWSKAKVLYTTGATGSIAFTSGTKSLSASFPHLKASQKTPVVRGKGEIPLTLKMDAFRTDASNEVEFSNDIT